MRMQGLSGPELQHRLRELDATLPIIFLTGQPGLSATVLAIKTGADDLDSCRSIFLRQ
jgi:FixJ family two-component response regulator